MNLFTKDLASQYCDLSDKDFKDSIKKIEWQAYSKADSALNIIEEILKTKTCNDFKTAHLLNVKATALLVLGDYKNCIKIGQDIILLGKKNSDPNIESMGNFQIYAGYINLERYDKAIAHAHEQINCLKKTDNKREIAWAYHNLAANLYNYFNDSLALAKLYISEGEKYLEPNDHNMQVSIMQMKGLINRKLGNDELAKIDFYNGLKLSKKATHNGTIATMYATYAMYLEDKNLDSAIIMYNLSNEYFKKDNILSGVAGNYASIGNLYSKFSNKNKAIDMYKKSIFYSEKANSSYWKVSALEQIHQLYAKQNNFKEAYFTVVNYHRCKDSVSSVDIKNQVEKREISFNYEKKAIVDSIAFAKEAKIKEAEIAQQKAEIKVKSNQQYGLFGGLALVLIFSGFMYNRFKITKKQKDIIEEQKTIVEHAHQELKEKNQEILDSISYAKRIQSAILPPNKLVKEYLNESFILYLPKDMVAGDFYWLEHIEGKILYAAADCTGHGVPGAMVSVVCNNGLNRSVREYGLTDPGMILNKTREIVIQEFEKSDEDVKDGMDISLVSLAQRVSEQSESEENNNLLTYTHTARWAGANNPLWIIRKGATMIEEVKPNKQPIGKYTNPQPFTTHTIELNTGDAIYIFTDGFQDQFGGDRGKKFKASQLKELLLSIQQQNMEQQKEVLNQTFEKWKGTLEQIDDVCIIGVRI
jgi:serine phosphatase RsbU (regulator of sigma subunit)